MEADDAFYIVLPSNVITDEFPRNTISKYSTPLPKPLTLRGGKWECSLSENHYSHSWYNITKNHNPYRFEIHVVPVPKKNQQQQEQVLAPSMIFHIQRNRV